MVRQALGILSGALGAMLVLPSLMFVFLQMRGFDFSHSPPVRIGLPIQLGVAALLIVVSVILLRGGRKKS